VLCVRTLCRQTPKGRRICRSNSKPSDARQVCYNCGHTQGPIDCYAIPKRDPHKVHSLVTGRTATDRWGSQSLGVWSLAAEYPEIPRGILP